jgi:hypothetical protein
MTQDITKSLEEVGAPAREFWENDLEMALENTFIRSGQDGFMNEWIGRRTGRQINVLCANLGIDGTSSVRQKKNSLHSPSNGQLLPYLFVDQFAKYKSKVATVDFAKGVLTGEMLEICRIKDDEFDKTALLFSIFHRRSTDLRLVFHLDKIHKTGFARMKLKERVRQPKKSFQNFLTPKTVKRILSGFDKSKGDGRTSEFKDVVIHDGHYLVFIRRAERPDLILRAGGVVHGHRPEWIILDFTNGAKRVSISSVSVSVPLEIANRLASGYFGKSCEYENESQITYAKQLERFLGLLKDKKAEDLSLVELVVSNSPLEGSPKIKITDPDSNPIGNAIGHFEKAIGGILSDIENIDSIKVYYRKKRVSLIFEKNEDMDDEYVVRYSDHRLNALERRLFEDHLRSTYGIPVLSTEKRFKR